MPDVLPFTTPATETLHTVSQALASLGAIGTALQNYPAVTLFISSLTTGFLPASSGLNWAIQIAALGSGGLCSGMVNFWMNVGLLDDFFKRIYAKKDDPKYKRPKLSTCEKLQYYGGIFVFVVTGLLFGLMAFTFAMEGPLAILSIAAGVFVAGIMTIQEVETWLVSYDHPNDAINEVLTQEQQWGKWIGHLIAAGNVLALSLLFTLSLAQGLMVLHVAALPALVIGFAVAFTFGAFTEFFFYNAYLANFCKNFSENWAKMLAIPHAWFGFLCVSTNAFVNAALTYAGVELLTGLLLLANIAVPPLAVIVTLAVISAVFAGSASFILGLDFWIKQNPVKPQVTTVYSKVSVVESGFGIFAANDETTDVAAKNCVYKPHSNMTIMK